MARFVPVDRDQRLLLPIDLREWIADDDLAHFVIETVDRVPVSRFRVNDQGSGSAQYHPQMMLALLVYCYAHGLFSSPADRASDASRRRGSLCGGEPPSGPRHDLQVSPRQRGGGRGREAAGGTQAPRGPGCPSGGGAGAGQVPAAQANRETGLRRAQAGHGVSAAFAFPPRARWRVSGRSS